MIVYLYILISDALRHTLRATLLLMVWALILASGSMAFLIKARGNILLESLVFWSPGTASVEALASSINGTARLRSVRSGRGELVDSLLGTVTGADVVMALLWNMCFLMMHGLYNILWRPDKYAFIHHKRERRPDNPCGRAMQARLAHVGRVQEEPEGPEADRPP